MDIKSSKSEIRKEIADLINRIKEQSDRIGNQREIPQSELDLILHRIEELHRRTVVWSYLNEQPETVPSPSTLGSARSDKDAQQEKVEYIDEHRKSSNDEKVVKPGEKELLKNDVQSEKFEAPTNPEPVVENKSETPIATVLSDRAEPRVDERKPEAPKFKDIKSFIGFNEKLMYIRQVFGGDAAAYEEALAQINGMNTYPEAEAYLSVLSSEYKWNHEHEPVAIFMQTVKRRFA